MDYWATGEASEKLRAHLGAATMEEVYRRLHIDAVYGVGGNYIGPATPPNEDVFGIRSRSVSYATGVYSETIYNPLAQYQSVEEIDENYRWPQADWWDYSNIPASIKGHEHQPIRGGGSEPFLQYCQLRGLEQAFIDLVDNPEIVHYCLDKLFGLAYANTLRIFETAAKSTAPVLFCYVAEDMGSQEGLLFSPAQIHTFLLPRMKRMIELADSAGVYVFHHSDGAVRPILPAMIDAGIDVLNPVQWRCPGMEREGLKKDFGDRLIFNGAVDNQQTLPFGTVEDVQNEVIENIRILGAGGGYILGPCHNIQAVGPPENIVAMYETGYAEGWT
jgi:uroporphyrinogen decarboxylase